MTLDEADAIADWLDENNNIKAALKKDKADGGFELVLWREDEEGKIVLGFCLTPSDTQ